MSNPSLIRVYSTLNYIYLKLYLYNVKSEIAIVENNDSYKFSKQE